jgi:hypothetical protein
MKMKCKDCKWWATKMSGNLIAGVCVRYSPRIVTGMIGGGKTHEYLDVGVWPATKEDSWCGEFEPIKPSLAEMREEDK